MWNFNNGSQLKEFTHHEPHMEFSALAFIHDSHKQSNQVGTWALPFGLYGYLLFFSGHPCSLPCPGGPTCCRGENIKGLRTAAAWSALECFNQPAATITSPMGALTGDFHSGQRCCGALGAAPPWH